MGKRSRDVSCSPSGDEAISDMTRPSTEPEDLRVAKLAAYDSPRMSEDKHIMQCSLPPHSASLGFASLEDFEIHYSKEHTNRCNECGKNFPSEHFLALHIDENHNPVREALAAKGEKTYACLVIDCEKKCSTPQKRRLHMIDKHEFPKAYNFRIVDHGIDNTGSLLQEGRKRRVSVTREQTTSLRPPAPRASLSSNNDTLSTVVKQTPSDHGRSPLPTRVESIAELEPPSELKVAPPLTLDSIDDVERSLAALCFVPRSVVSKQAKHRV